MHIVPRYPWFILAMVAMIFTPAIAGDDKVLTDVLDAYNTKARAGDIDAMLALRTAAVREEIGQQILKKDDREYFLLISEAQVPDAYEVQHVNWSEDGNSAEMYATLQLPKMKKIDRPRTSMEMLLTFFREDGAWKLSDMLPLGDPGEVKRPTDLGYNQNEANTDVTAAEVAGRIVSIDFKPDHTLVMLRLMDEELAVFLPPRSTLDEAGVDFNELAPWKRRVFIGYPHRTDDLRFFATGDRPMD